MFTMYFNCEILNFALDTNFHWLQMNWRIFNIYARISTNFLFNFQFYRFLFLTIIITATNENKFQFLNSKERTIATYSC